MSKCLNSLLVAFAMLFAVQAKAMVSPVSFGILPPLQFPPSDFDVTGLRASVLWGNHRSIYGIDLGVIGNVTNVTFTGLAVSGIFNLTHSTTTVIGTQLAGFANINTAKVTITGLQAALGINNNITNTSLVGLQFAGIANMSAFTKVYGAQVAIFNKALDVYGFQIGLVNFTSTLHGFQIGLLNFNEKGTFVVSPILNAGF